MAAKALESIFSHINHYRILYFEETLVTIAEKNSKFCHQYSKRTILSLFSHELHIKWTSQKSTEVQNYSFKVSVYRYLKVVYGLDLKFALGFTVVFINSDMSKSVNAMDLFKHRYSGFLSLMGNRENYFYCWQLRFHGCTPSPQTINNFLLDCIIYSISFECIM